VVHGSARSTGTATDFRQLSRVALVRTVRVVKLLLWLAVSVPVFVGDDPEALRQLWLKLTAVALLAVAIAISDKWPVVAAAVPATLALAASPDLFSDNLAVAQVLLAFLLGRRAARMRTGLLFFTGVCMACLVRVAVTPGVAVSAWFGMVATVLLMIVLPWLAGRYARQHDELVRTGWELAERLEREHDLVGDRMRLLERSRIAGDMHDSLGHELSLVALRAAALQVNPGLDDPARQAARELRESAAKATERLHELIDVLRADSDPAPILPP
jgi:signal transduction histidine kinase